ncbi:uncharacterized protein EI97DRAFT_463648 [Westerdykella ornata]|uniref:Mid2 domain-containing protein n=1 Tax=Westerdykella ornata TaxID=318751 RepID=A0A6A6JXE7_WESOR|nr:uncharacterized protein EI97DRAFT_463648 [Westerdykella ornata]KAF2281292.1 hypothetical protein EI97DRAFT_463648 [Westerdykella ornata]
MILSASILSIMIAAAVIAQEPTQIPPAGPGDPTNTQKIDQDTLAQSDGTVAPLSTGLTTSYSHLLFPTASVVVTELRSSPTPLSDLLSDDDYGSVRILGWTYRIDGNSPYNPFWAPMTYAAEYTTYSTSSRFFELCTQKTWDSTGDKFTFKEPCIPIYTECGGGWIRGPSTSKPCETAEASHKSSTDQDILQYRLTSSCITDLLYSTYGAWDPLSRIRCERPDLAGASPNTIYRMSPTEKPTINYEPSYSPQSGSNDKDSPPLGVYIGVPLGLLAAALIALQILLWKRKRQAERVTAANAGEEAETARNSEDLPKYTGPVAVPDPVVLPDHRIGDDDMSVRSTDPPPYAP